jgi:hypothetical protein
MRPKQRGKDGVLPAFPLEHQFGLRRSELLFLAERKETLLLSSEERPWPGFIVTPVRQV